jgi:hypothetical protein
MGRIQYTGRGFIECEQAVKSAQAGVITACHSFGYAQVGKLVATVLQPALGYATRFGKVHAWPSRLRGIWVAGGGGKFSTCRSSL